MRIAMVVHNAVAHDARVLKSASSLKSAGHDVRLFGLTPEDSEYYTLPNGVPVTLSHRHLSGIRDRVKSDAMTPGRESSIKASFLIQGETIFEAVRGTFTPDLVHVHDHVALTAAQAYKKEFNCAIIWDAHEIYEDLASIDESRATVNAAIVGQNTKYVDGFITLNESIANFYRRRYPDLPTATLLPNAVEHALRDPYDGRLHRAANLDLSQKILLFQGGFANHRGIPALVEAARQLNSEWSVVFMGWGKLEGHIRENMAGDLSRPDGRSSIAVVPGAPHSELLSWTAGASLGAIPYENTGLNHLYCSPNKLWEYPEAGAPILATDLPELERQIAKYGVGVTVSRELNPSEIAAAVNRLSSEDLKRMKARCSVYAREESWQSYQTRLFELYSDVGARSGITVKKIPSLLSRISRGILDMVRQ